MAARSQTTTIDAAETGCAGCFTIWPLSVTLEPDSMRRSVVRLAVGYREASQSSSVMWSADATARRHKRKEAPAHPRTWPGPLHVSSRPPEYLPGGGFACRARCGFPSLPVVRTPTVSATRCVAQNQVPHITEPCRVPEVRRFPTRLIRRCLRLVIVGRQLEFEAQSPISD